jgi:uncharacterized membrane protein YkoI
MNRKLVIAAVAASALAVGGTTAAFAGDSDGTTAPSGAPSQSQSQDDDRDESADRDDRDDAKALSGAQVSAKEASDKALASVNGEVESIELDDEGGGRLAWDADVLGDDGTWHEVRVDAASGKVTQQQADDRDDHADDDRDDRDDRDDD